MSANVTIIPNSESVKFQVWHDDQYFGVVEFTHADSALRTYAKLQQLAWIIASLEWAESA